MYAAAMKSKKKNKSRAVANVVGQKKRSGKQGFGFVDKRPIAFSQKKMKQAMERSESNMKLLKINSDLKKHDLVNTNHSTTQNCMQCAFNNIALNNFDAAQRIITAAETNYIALDNTLDGNRGNWGFSNNTWNTLRQNITAKSNHIRGQGVADALESLSWNVNAITHAITGPGGHAGVDLRLFTTGGMGAQRMDVEVKHAGSLVGVYNQIHSAVNAHGQNQTVKMYLGTGVNVPNAGVTFTRGTNNYTVRTLIHNSTDPSVYVEFFRDTNPTTRIGRRIVTWQ